MKDLRKLKRKVFGTKATREKYDTRMFGCGPIGYMGYDKKKPIAYYGVFPLILRYNDKLVSCAQSGDTMTHPDYRGRGLFTRLAKRTYDKCKELGVSFVFGFPNENSYPGFVKLGWSFHGTMYRKEINGGIPVCELVSKLKFLRPFYDLYLRLVIKKSKPNPDLFTHGYSQILKDKNFFDYKLKGKGVYYVKHMGVDMLIKVDGHLYVGVVSQRPWMAIADLSKRLMCGRAIMDISKNHYLFDEGMKPSHPIGFYNIDFYSTGIDPEKIIFEGADYDTF